MIHHYNYSHRIQTRVRYSETDQMGFCYYGNFLQYYEMGRVECLRSLGINYKNLENEGFFLPVLDIQVKYKIPCYYDDLLTIETKIVAINGSRISFDYIIFNESGNICNTATTTLVFLSKQFNKPVRCPKSIITKLSTYVE